jgi:hypothetical protein
MISVAEIKRFPDWKQLRIREEIAKWVRNGQHADHLCLGHDGSVMLDRDAATDAQYAKLYDRSGTK